jgi:hypothetical protein
MRRRRSFLAVSFVLAALIALAGAEERVHVCYGLKAEPTLDGNVKDDPAWRDIPEAAGFVVWGTMLPASEQTALRMAYTPQALFIAVVCEESGQVKAEAKDGEGKVFSDDSLEIFLFPQGSAEYHQFAANTTAARFQLVCQGGTYKAVPLGDWQARTHHGDGFWSLEVRIPFEVLKTPSPKKGDVWTGNIARNDQNKTGAPHSWWALLRGTRCHEPEHFGKLAFAGPFSAGERRRAESKAVRAYFADEAKERAAALARQGENVRTYLVRAPSQQTAYSEWLDRCQALGKQAERVKRLSLDEALRLLGGLRRLRHDLDVLKERILTDFLFSEPKKEAVSCTD